MPRMRYFQSSQPVNWLSMPGWSSVIGLKKGGRVP